MRVAVWDFNGIIVDDAEAHRLATNAIFALFSVAPLADLDVTRRYTTTPFLLGFENAGIPREAFTARQPEIDRLYHDTYMASESAYRLRAGVRECLNWVKAQGGSNIILTNTRGDVLNRQLEHLGIADAFDWISTAEDRKKLAMHMNKSDRLKAYFNGLATPLLNGVIIGDSIEEPAVARELGIASIAVTGGWFDRDRLAAAKPDHLIDCITALPAILAPRWA